MATVTVRGLDEDVKARIQHRAKANGRSLEAELRRIISQAADDEKTVALDRAVDVGTQIRSIFKGSGEDLMLPGRDESQREVIL